MARQVEVRSNSAFKFWVYQWLELKYCSLLTVLLLASCATIPLTQTVKPIVLKLQPSSLGKNLSLSSIAVGQFDGKKIKIRVEVEITRDRLTVIGISGLGIPLFLFEQESGQPIAANFVDGQTVFNPHFMMFDMYLIHWPAPPLRVALADFGMTLIEDREEDTRKVIDSAGELIAEVHCWSRTTICSGNIAETRIRHYDLPYEIRIISIGEDARS